MRDEITWLCRRLVSAEDPGELVRVGAELQSAIRHRMERVREEATNAFDGVMLRKPQRGLRPRQIQEENC